MDKQTEQTILEMYAKRRSLKKIGKAIGWSEHLVKKWLIENNYYTGHRGMLYYTDEFFFDKIDTEEKAYWLGFIYADGYLSSPRTIGIEIKIDDIDHLQKFKQALHSELNVHTYHKNSTFGPQTNCRFAFSSKHMYKILLSYFKSVDKTNYGIFPKLSDSTLIPHLIRGFFDGDGSITGVPKDSEHLWRPQISFIGTKETLEYIETISGFSWDWSQRYPEKNTNNYQISCGRVNDCLSFLHYMYDNAHIYLDRKYKRYIDMAQNRKRNQAKARV